VTRDGQPFPWPASCATGVGSMPGADPAEALAVVLGEVPELPFLPELPGRGPGADMIGRTAALLVDLPVETTPRGWRLALRGGRDLGQARGLMSADLDAMEAATSGYAGTFKIQLAGPWTLAASLELTSSLEPALADDGAARDLLASLAEGAASHVAAVRRRVPAATIIVQLDEPMLPGVLAGSVPTASGLYRLPAVDESVAAASLRAVLDATQAPTVVHCCARDIPFRVITAAGASSVSFDLGLIPRAREDDIGEAAESGAGLLIGAVPTSQPAAGPGQAAAGGRAASSNGTGLVTGRQPAGAEAAARATAVAVIGLWRRIGLAEDALARQVVVTPACGLAGLPPGVARDMLARCQAAARLIPELIQEGVA
jgi:hypothetical protein